MHALSLELGNLRSEFISAVPRVLGEAEAARIAQRLQLLQRLAKAMEQELDVHRLAEASGRRVDAMGAGALTALGDLVADPDGKIVRPDFGRRGDDA